MVERLLLDGAGGGLLAATGGSGAVRSAAIGHASDPVPALASAPLITPAGGFRSATGSALGSPYSYGPESTTGMCAKFSGGGGEETCHSRPRERHGLPVSGTRQTTVDITKLITNRSTPTPRTNAEIDTHSFSPSRLAAYSKTRRGWPSSPTANSGMKVELNAR